MEDFDLSKEIYGRDVCPVYTDEIEVINVYHIKKFIKLLKRIFPNADVPIKSSDIHEAINKFAGDKLNEK